MSEWISLADQAVASLDSYIADLRNSAFKQVCASGKIDPKAATEHQYLLHSLAWSATTCEALRALVNWANVSMGEQRFTHVEELVLRIGFGEYLAQIIGGLPMSQNEFARPAMLGVADAAARLAADAAVSRFLIEGNDKASRAELVALILAGDRPNEALGDEMLDMIRDQFRNFTREKITPSAHRWHLEDALFPADLLDEMAQMGVFGICIAEEDGGLGLSKLAMCIVTEELSRGWICAGSLGTRSEIAGELISANGTVEQKQRWLPAIASGEILPTAVFTEPDVGSDLASVKTKAIRTEDGWRVSGSKSWITHAARADLMTILVRTDASKPGHDGLSMLLAPKSRADNGADFPDHGLDGSEIEVLGYRGMKEYSLSFDDFLVAEDGLLGGKQGLAFKQLMATFEGARIQTAARAVGVAWTAFDLAVKYAMDRHQFGRSLADFPRVSDKLALMLVELVMSRELTYRSARLKDEGRRCDVEAGMAKLLAARVAWTNADANVQIHGGNGYALEYEASRILCDARILNIFEGAAEIQATVVARGLLNKAN